MRARRWTFQPPFGTPLDLSHPLHRGLTGCWLLNAGGGETAYDLGPYRYHGTLNTVDYSTFVRGRSVIFDAGPQDRIVLPSAAAQIGTGDFSFSAWVLVDDTGALKTVLASKRSGGAGTQAGYAAYFESDESFVWRVDDGAGGSSLLDSVSSLGTGLHHIVCVYEQGARLALYDNGAFVKEETASIISGDLTAPQATRIGAHGSDNFEFSGHIEQVVTWNRALTYAEVLDLYVNPYGIYQPRRASVFVSAAAAFSIAADATSYAWTGQAATLQHGRKLSAETTAYTWTGQTAGLALGRNLVAGATAYTWTPQTAGLAFNRALSAESSAYAWTGDAATLAYGRALAAESTSYAWTPQAAGLAHGRSLTAASTSYAWTPQVAGLAFGRHLTAGATAYTWTPQEATLTYTPAAGSFTLTADATSYAWTPQTTTLALGRVVSADATAYTWTPQTAGVALGRNLPAGAAPYTWTPQAATLRQTRVLPAEATSYTWTGQSVALALGFVVSAEATSYAWTGATAGLAFGRHLGAGAAAYAWTGAALTFTYSGAFVLPAVGVTVNTSTVSARANTGLVPGRTNTHVP